MSRTISWGEYVISENMELSLTSRINVNKTKSLEKWEGTWTAFLRGHISSCSRKAAALPWIAENSCIIQRAALLRKAHHYFIGTYDWICYNKEKQDSRQGGRYLWPAGENDNGNSSLRAKEIALSDPCFLSIAVAWHLNS